MRHVVLAIQSKSGWYTGGKVVPQRLGGCWLRESFQLDISVPEEDPEAALKESLLVSSALGSSHFLTAKAYPVSLAHLYLCVILVKSQS